MLESSEDVLVLETTYAPGGSPPPAHFHPAQTEHFEILAGAVHVEVAGRRRQLATGEQLDVPAERGAPDVEPERRSRTGTVGDPTGGQNRTVVPRARRSPGH